MRRAANACALLVAVSLWACGGKDEEAIAPLPEGASSAVTRWIPVGHPEDEGLLEAPAIVRAGADARGEVGTTVSARVARVHVRVGEVVAAGNPVVEVAAPSLVDAASAHVGASRRLAVHAARAEELRAMREEGLVRRSDVFEQEALVADLRAARDRAAATLSAAGLEPRQAAAIARTGRVVLRAPVAGVVTAVDARLGEIREPGAGPLARIAGTGEVRVEVRTSESWPDDGTPTFVGSDGASIALLSAPLSRTVDPDDGTRIAWYAPADESVRLADGLRGVVRLSNVRGAWEVPVDAVEVRSGRTVLVRRRDGAASAVEVQVVSSSGATAWVRANPEDRLGEGDEVAADLARYRRGEGSAAR